MILYQKLCIIHWNSTNGILWILISSADYHWDFISFCTISLLSWRIYFALQLVHNLSKVLAIVCICKFLFQWIVSLRFVWCRLLQGNPSASVYCVSLLIARFSSGRAKLETPTEDDRNLLPWVRFRQAFSFFMLEWGHGTRECRSSQLRGSDTVKFLWNINRKDSS